MNAFVLRTWSGVYILPFPGLGRIATILLRTELGRLHDTNIEFAKGQDTTILMSGEYQEITVRKAR